MYSNLEVTRPTNSKKNCLARIYSRGSSAFLSAVIVLSYGASAEAQCLKCSASTEQSSCTASDAWAFCCVPGFVLADNSDNGSSSISATIGQNSLQMSHTLNSSGCCTGPYANIGIFDACQASDQWAQPGSHLPLQLKDIAKLNGAWTFQVPMPLKTDWQVEQYRVYYEMFLSNTTDGHWDYGNITVDFFNNNYGYNPTAAHAPINGSQGMDVVDYGGTPGQGHGPFLAFLYPKGTFAPDGSGVITVTSTDVKAVLDWAVANYPKYFTSSLYLSNLSLAVEAGAFHGVVKSSYVSFAIQKAGSDVVYTPAWTADHWSNVGGALGTGGAGSGPTSGGAAAMAGAGSDAGDTPSPGASADAGPRTGSDGSGCGIASRGTRNASHSGMGLGLLAAMLLLLKRRG